jgi:hypothetical protein
MKVEEAKDVRIIASVRKRSLPTPKRNRRDVMYVLTLISNYKRIKCRAVARIFFFYG